MALPQNWLIRMCKAIFKFLLSVIFSTLKENQIFYIIFDNGKIFKSDSLTFADNKYFYMKFLFYEKKIYLLEASLNLHDNIFEIHLPKNISIIHNLEQFCAAHSLLIMDNKISKIENTYTDDSDITV